MGNVIVVSADVYPNWPDEAVEKEARAEAARSGVRLGPYQGIVRIPPDAVEVHVFGDREEVDALWRWERDRRAACLPMLEQAAGVLDPPPEPWQVDLAGRILARRYRWSPTGRGDIWVFAHTTASELAHDMEADGRLDRWGNWPGDSDG